MWTPTTRRQHSRAGLRYASDLTDAEWAMLEPMLPAELGAAASGHGRCGRSSTRSSTCCAAASPGGCCRTASRRGRRSMAGLPVARRRDLGGDQPPSGHARPRAGRARREPDGGGDRQPKRQDDGERRRRGYDAGKKIKGRKRHAMVDTDGRALELQAHAADIQDRDGAGPLLQASRA